MRKRYIKNMLMTLVVVILTMSTTFALAEDKVNGFPLPTNKSYAVTVLSRIFRVVIIMIVTYIHMDH